MVWDIRKKFKVAHDDDGTAKTASIATADIADDAVNAAKLNCLVTAEQTGDGSWQAITHALGSTPTLVIPVAFASDANLAINSDPTSTKVFAQAKTGTKYKLLLVA